MNGKAAEGDIVFKKVYGVEFRNKVSLFLGDITRANPFLLNKKGFYVGLIGLFVLSGAGFLTSLVKVFIEKE